MFDPLGARAVIICSLFTFLTCRAVHLQMAFGVKKVLCSNGKLLWVTVRDCQ